VRDRDALMLVARREFVERMRDRSFQVSTGVTLAIVAAVAVLAGVIGSEDPERYTVAARGGEPLAIARAARAVAPEFKARVEVRGVKSERAARAGVRAEDYDAALLRGGRLLTKEDADEELEQAVQAGASRVRVARVLRSEGVSAAVARRALDSPPLRVSALEKGADKRKGFALAASFLLYGMLITYGLWVAMGVVEEKASRVIELLLATVRPLPLLSGKVVGLGLLGLAQLVLFAIVGLALAAATDAVELDGETLRTIPVVLVWFLLGYALYAWLYATAGVLVSRQEDVQSATTPLTILIICAFFVVFPAMGDPSGTLARVTSIVPFSSPLVMPGRVAVGEASGVEIAASLGLLAGTVALLVPVGVRIYEAAILRMGKPVGLAEAFGAVRGVGGSGAPA
jgi:ABC-2 type transport system permease protein